MLLYDFIKLNQITPADGIEFILKVENSKTFQIAFLKRMSVSKIIMLPAILNLCIFFILIGKNFFFDEKMNKLINDLNKKILERNKSEPMNGYTYMAEFDNLLDKFLIKDNSCIILLIKLKQKKNYKVC